MAMLRLTRLPGRRMKWRAGVFTCAFLVSPALAPVWAQATFYKDILPILQTRCQICHRAGEIAPMPFTTYAETRPWAKAIREQITLRKMPPWFADPKVGEFANDPSLTPAQIAAVQQWVDAGAPEGSKRDAPPPVKWPAQGVLAAPDIEIGMPRPFLVAADATVEYQYIVFHPQFSVDRWVRAVEIRPGDPAVVHHAVLYVREPGSKWLQDVPAGVMYSVPPGNTDAVARARQTTSDILAVYTPGSPVMICPDGMAKKIPAGSDLVLQLHYTSKKVPRTDQTEIRMVESTSPPQLRLLTLQMSAFDIRLRPGEANQRFSVSGTLPREALLVSLFPHMHLRGSGFEFQIPSPGGRVETLLKVDNYDFYWQLSYQLKTPRKLAAGTRLLWTGIYDNSANNPRNPDPKAEVTWGDQSWEEMMVGFFDVAVPVDVDKEKFFVRESIQR
jgi:hypothetical protein